MGSLTRSIADRIFIALVSLFFAPICAFILYARFCISGEPDDWVLRLLLLVFIEGAAAVLVVSLLGIAWAIWTPDWIERLLRRAFRHFAVAALVFGFVVTAILFYLIGVMW